MQGSGEAFFARNKGYRPTVRRALTAPSAQRPAPSAQRGHFEAENGPIDSALMPLRIVMAEIHFETGPVTDFASPYVRVEEPYRHQKRCDHHAAFGERAAVTVKSARPQLAN